MNRTVQISCFLVVCGCSVSLPQLVAVESRLKVKLPRVEGEVVDEQGMPVPGAKVFVENNQHWKDIEWRLSMPEKDDVLGSAVTDDDGRFVIDWKQPEVSAIADVSLEAKLLIFSPRHSIAYRRFSLEYSPQIVKFRLTPTNELVGVVYDDNRSPVQDATVYLDMIYMKQTRLAFVHTTEETLSLIHSSLRPRVKTDSMGRFRLPGASSGQIALLQIVHPDHVPIRRYQPVDELSPRDIVAPRANAEIVEWYSEYGKEMRMPTSRMTEYQVIDKATDKVVANAQVCPYYSGCCYATDERGRVRLPVRSDGIGSSHRRRVLYIKHQEMRIWSKALVESGKSIELPLRRMVSGHVLDKETGKPIGGVGVYVGVLGGIDFDGTSSAADGSYELEVYSNRADITLCGPKTPYILPVARLTSSSEEAELEAEPNVHIKQMVFQPEATKAIANFEVGRYSPIKIRIVDENQNPVSATEATLIPSFFAKPLAKAVSDKDGFASFEIDRPLKKSMVAVASAKGFGSIVIEGMPNEVLLVTLQPSTFVSGQITIEKGNGDLFPVSAIQIFVDLDEGLRPIILPIALTDEEGRYEAYLPWHDRGSASLSVPPHINLKTNSWSVDLSKDSEVDFTAVVR